MQVLSSAASTICLSPIVAEDIFWVLGRLSRSYFFADVRDYSNPPTAIISQYGSTANGAQVIEFIIQAIRRNFELWKGEEGILTSMINFLHNCTTVKELELHIIQSQSFVALMSYFLDSLSSLPDSIHQSLIRTMTMMVTNSPDINLSLSMLQKITQEIHNRFVALVQRKDFTAVYQTPEVFYAVTSTLEMFTGLCMANTYSTSKFMMAFMKPHLPDFIKLLQLYRSVSEAEIYVLELFVSLVKYQVCIHSLSEV